MGTILSKCKSKESVIPATPTTFEEKVASNELGIRENIVRSINGVNVFEHYDVIRVVGEGSMGSISEVRRRVDKHAPAQVRSPKSSNQEVFALKQIMLDRISKEFLDELRNEIDILRKMDHPNIIKAYETFERKHKIFIVMEYCSGGDLYARTPYSEREAAKIIVKLLSAISYMHKSGVVHRDLKFENIMFESKSPDSEIKVIDFGLSKRFLPDESRYMTQGVGTIYTMAPQVLQGIYTYKADLWSVGVVSYMLLSSTKPFWGRTRRQIVDQILRCQLDFSGPGWSHVSDEAKKFVSNLIVINPQDRVDAEQALKMKWLNDVFPLSDRRPDETIMADVANNLINHASGGELRRLALMIVAHKTSTQEIIQLRQVFDQYDSSNDGTITLEEFRQALAQYKFTDDDLDKIFHNLDIDKNGYIQYTEFLAATLETLGNVEENHLIEAFRQLDEDKSGYITFENLRNVLGKHFTKEKVDSYIEEADTNRDGKISLIEFLELFHRRNVKDIRKVASNIISDNNPNQKLLDETSFIPGGKYDDAHQEDNPPKQT